VALITTFCSVAVLDPRGSATLWTYFLYLSLSSVVRVPDLQIWGIGTKHVNRFHYDFLAAAKYGQQPAELARLLCSLAVLDPHHGRTFSIYLCHSD